MNRADTKKRVVYIFSLILYLLIVCTVVSQKIETEMRTQAEVSARRHYRVGENAFSVSEDAVFRAEDGIYLYEVVDGNGWTEGEVFAEISAERWGMSGAGKCYIANDRNYTIVENASRVPKAGEKVEIVKIPGRTDDYIPFTDQYLIYYPKGMPDNFILPDDSKIVLKSDKALLLDMGDIVYPFFERRAKQMSDSLEYEECRIFSVTEIGEFLEQLPRVAVLAVYLLFPILFWGCSGMLLKDVSKYRAVLLFNAGMTAFFLFVAARLLVFIDFPASMLPPDNIFDIQHYVQEFRMILQAQRELEMPGNTVEVLLGEVWKTVGHIAGVGIFAGGVVAAFEVRGIQ